MRIKQADIYHLATANVASNSTRNRQGTEILRRPLFDVQKTLVCIRGNGIHYPVYLNTKGEYVWYYFAGAGGEGDYPVIGTLEYVHGRLLTPFPSETKTLEILLQEEAEAKREMASYEAVLSREKEDVFGLYQLKGGAETRDLHFAAYDRLKASGYDVLKDKYELVYAGSLAQGTSLDDIYTRFNIDHPKDFKGHSLSVSDVILLRRKGKDTAYYVDTIGFREISAAWCGAAAKKPSKEHKCRSSIHLL